RGSSGNYDLSVRVLFLGAPYGGSAAHGRNRIGPSCGLRISKNRPKRGVQQVVIALSQRLSIALSSFSSSLERSDKPFCGMLRAFSSTELDIGSLLAGREPATPRAALRH